MCGIAGAYRRREGRLPDAAGRKAAIEAIKHRGPDATGNWSDEAGRVWIGHTRLAIIDLDPRSNQPFVREGLALTFNGEIYNYRDLQSHIRNKGYELVTDSDTEVILLLYKEYGPGCLDMLEGMFSFAIFDEASGELFCARDRIGEKPFMYAETRDAFVFASEIPALHATGIVPRTISSDESWRDLYDIPAFRRIPEPFSAWASVSKLPPASWLKVRDGMIVDRGTYWKTTREEDTRITPADVRAVVIEAVKRASTADVPVAVLLSGGVDSTIIAAVLTRELGQRVTGYAFGHDEHDPEIQRARDAAAAFDIPLKEFYFRDADLKRELADLIATYGEPFYLQQVAYASILFRAIRADGCKVVLGGNGADELFYGYVSHGRTRLVSQALALLGIRDAWWLKRRKLLRGTRLGTEDALAQVYAGIEHLMRPFRNAPLLDLASRFALLSENAHSITLLGDLAGMRHAVELRSPFLDRAVVEIAGRIPMRMKVPKPLDRSGVTNKWILREAFKDLVPERILRRRKMGFGYAIPEGSGLGGSTRAFAEWSLNTWKEVFGKAR